MPERKGQWGEVAKGKARRDFGKRLREAVARRWPGRGGASRLAEALGVTASHAAAYLRGDRLPRGDVALRLPSVLGVPAGYFSAIVLGGKKSGPGSPAAERSEPGLDTEAYTAGARAALDEMAAHITELRLRWVAPDLGENREIVEAALTEASATEQQQAAQEPAERTRRKKRA